jgi:hypothetical protein
LREKTDARVRGDHTDEAIRALHGWWSGEPFTDHHVALPLVSGQIAFCVI